MLLMMGEDTTQNMWSSFPEINKLCKVASRWKYIKTNVSTFTAHMMNNRLFYIYIYVCVCVCVCARARLHTYV